MGALAWFKNDFCISTDREKLDLKAIHFFLSTQAYWSLNIPYEIVEKAADHSLNFGLYYKDRQIGYARIISDYSTMAYLGDVYVLEEFRGQGLSKWLMEVVRGHPDLQGLRRWLLLTRDAHGLYKQFGWTAVANPDFYLEIHDKNIYQM